jgi:hypothetical protein
MLCRMAMLELVQTRPDWLNALGVALTRPPGVPERRGGEDAWHPEPRERPRRISDDLAWLRQAIDEPEDHGLRELHGTAAVAAWESPEEGDVHDRLQRLATRHVLDAAGFLLHAAEDAALA